MAHFHEPRGWMLGRPEVTGLRFAAGESRGYHPRHLQHLGRRQVCATTVEYLVLRWGAARAKSTSGKEAGRGCIPCWETSRALG